MNCAKQNAAQVGVLVNPERDEKSCSGARRTGVEDEQDLCSEALESGDYDKLSDADWIRLCEDLAAKRRDDDRRPSESA